MAHGKGLKHGKGSCKRAIDYLLGDYDHKNELRGGVDVLRGDPYAVAALADSLMFSQRYTSYVYGWAPEEKPTLDEIQALIDDWSSLAFAGLESDRVMYTAILHTSTEAKFDLHLIVAKVDIETGKSFNPCPPRSLVQFNRVRDVHNFTNGWARPDDPKRARLIQPGGVAHNKSEPSDEVPKTKPQMHAVLKRMVDAGELTTGVDVRNQVRKWGDVTREGDNYISIKTPDTSRSVRLKGKMFEPTWVAKGESASNNSKTEDRSSYRGGQVDLDQAREHRNRLNAEIATRAAYNQKRYPPRPFNDSIHVMAQLREEQQVNHDRNRAIAAAAAQRVTSAETERNQQIRATVERAISTATATTGAIEQLERNHRSANRTLRRAVIFGRRASRFLGQLTERCYSSVERLRAIGSRAEQWRSRNESSTGIASTTDRRSASGTGDFFERIADLGRRISSAAEALSSVRLSALDVDRKQSSKNDEFDDALDAAFKALLDKDHDHLQKDRVVRERPIEAEEIDLSNDPLAAPGSSKNTSKDLNWK